jgi:hypothetical protein
LTEMDFLTVSVKMAQTFEATTIRGKRGTFITLVYCLTRAYLAVCSCVASNSELQTLECAETLAWHRKTLQLILPGYQRQRKQTKFCNDIVARTVPSTNLEISEPSSRLATIRFMILFLP